ncbi:glycosyltransferase [Aureliella helgolandensis]|uniref:Poly-beta-1,6-N-acetyl-D-glucosamine synthase n=1 Tax=Aureliella helgolandensis TaxID=2527968 RepID=A0A518GG56_9BACT|nr:glycosyltransferase family 2 protein [Aureliella helgolandensis]QDV27585.1 Poly-beta-1,6-N-acetyl-D-glucosamine synthase [Aureliella helgolandensis]
MAYIWDYLLLAGCVGGALMSLFVRRRFQRALQMIQWTNRPQNPAECQTSVSVIVPARNEEKDICSGLHSILEQSGVNLEVLVINDHSSDQTGEIADSMAAKDGRLTVLHDPLLQPGWLGKANAMQTASKRADGEYLLFSDADIQHAPDCFRTALAEFEHRQLDFLSLLPSVQCVSLWENINIPMYMGGMALLIGPAMADPQKPDSLGAGAFMLIRATAFHAVGGYESLKGEMLDDVGMAKLLKREGYRVDFHAAPDLLTVRLFKGNHDAFWGTTKNILAGLNGRTWFAPIALVLPIVVFWPAPAAFAYGIATGSFGLALIGAATYLYQYGNLFPSRCILAFHRGKTLLFPLVAVVVFCCVLRALYFKICRGSIVWRKRVIRVAEE